MIGISWIIGDKGEVEIKYFLSGELAEIKFSEEANDKQRLWVFDVIAIKADDIKFISNYMKDIGKKVTVKEVPPEVTFERFWKEYAHKVGKVEAQKAWKKMSKADKIEALIKVKPFKKWSNGKGYDLPYPSKYLNKRRYDDDYK